MIEAKPYPHEKKRLEAVRELGLLDMPIEERFERITRMVCRTLNVPIAIFNLIDEDRQHYKSVQGLEATDVALDGAFCTHAIHEKEMLLVPDASKDKRFHDNPFVTGKFLNVGFYAGVPVRAPNGMPIGTLCAIDTRPRDMSSHQLGGLRDLAAMVEDQMRCENLNKTHAQVMADVDPRDRQDLIDPLTRLWNRDGMMHILEREWAQAGKDAVPVSVILATIDNLKSITNAFGNQAGEAALKGAAKKMLEALKGEDTVGRVGPQDFMIVHRNVNDIPIAEIIAHVGHTMTVEPLMIGLTKYNVTLSFGAASAIPGEGTIDALIHDAEHEMFRVRKLKNKSAIQFA